MKELVNTGSREGALRFLPLSLAFAAIVVVLLRLLPVLAVFYAIPLFFVLFRYGKSAFAFSVAIACVLDVLTGFAFLALSPGARNGTDFLGVVAGSFFFILPLLALLASERIRLRYRVALAGLATAIMAIAYIALSGSFSVVSDIVRETSIQLSASLKPYLPEGYDGAVLGMKFSPDGVYDMMIRILSYSVLPMPVIMLTIDAAIAARIEAGGNRVKRQIVDLARYTADPFLFAPFAGGMCGIIAGKLFDSAIVMTLSWNVALLTGFYFFLQGAGLLQFFGALAGRRSRMLRFWSFLLCFLVVVYGFIPQLAVLLLIAGVVELFVPLRARFIHTDADHPTPGPGGGNS